MATKDSMKSIETLFKKTKKGDIVTLENIAKEYGAEVFFKRDEKMEAIQLEN